MTDRLNILGPKLVVTVGNEEFCVRKLLVSANGAEILKALGGERARVEHSNLDRFLTTADRSQWYLAFIDNRAVYVRWCSGGWDRYSVSIGCLCAWCAGHLVLSPVILESK